MSDLPSPTEAALPQPTTPAGASVTCLDDLLAVPQLAELILSHLHGEALRALRQCSKSSRTVVDSRVDSLTLPTDAAAHSSLAALAAMSPRQHGPPAWPAVKRIDCGQGRELFSERADEQLAAALQALTQQQP